MKHHIASPGAPGTSDREHHLSERAQLRHDGDDGGSQNQAPTYNQVRMTDALPAPLTRKSAESALAELSSWTHGAAARKAPTQASFSEMGTAIRSASLATSQGAHADAHYDAQEGEVLPARTPETERMPLARKSAELNLAELSNATRGGDPSGAQNAVGVARKRPADALLSELGGARQSASLAASPRAHGGNHDDAEEGEALRSRVPGVHARKTRTD